MHTDKLEASNAPSECSPYPGFSQKVPGCVAEKCYERRGVIMPKYVQARCLDQLEKMETRPDDIFTVTYPKSGTLWISQLIILLQLDGDLAETHLLKLTTLLEVTVDFSLSETAKTMVERAETMSSSHGPRILASHCPTEWLPEDIRTDDPKRKVVYLARNPKDTAVSFYHFCRYWNGLPSYESWDIFFEEFVAGRAPYGSWFENVLPWWRRRNHPNVLFLKYEDMKRDLRGVVRKISNFMGKSLSNDVMDEIAEVSTFAAMKKSKKSNPDFFHGKLDADPNCSYMRKGEVGEWKNYFTQDQNERFDELYRQKMAGSGLEMEFELK